jgi:H+/Na+-translocating ferredoxin:NAD+ oxidoreductase subunit G
MSATGHGAEAAGPGAQPAPGAATQREVAGWRLLATLGFAGAVAGLLIVIVYGWAQPRIRAHQALVLRAAIEEVLEEPDHYQTLYVNGGALTTSLPPGADSLSAERVYLGFDADNHPIGFAVPGAEPGFQDVISLIFGYDPRTDRLMGMKVLDSKETPGLGDRITSDSVFIGGFNGVTPLLVGVKRNSGQHDKHDVDMITGATISSRAVIAIINHRMEKLQPLLQAYLQKKMASR